MCWMFWIFFGGCITTSNFICLNFSTKWTCSSRRTDTIIYTKINKPPLSNKPSPHSRVNRKGHLYENVNRKQPRNIRKRNYEFRFPLPHDVILQGCTILPSDSETLSPSLIGVYKHLLIAPPDFNRAIFMGTPYHRSQVSK